VRAIKEIARDLKVSRNTVRKVLRSGETSFEYERNVQPRPKLGRWTAGLEQVLAANATQPAREQLTLIRIFEELRGRGYDGGYDAVRRYARRWAKQHGEATAAILASFSLAAILACASALRARYATETVGAEAADSSSVGNIAM
jgi:transposase